MTFEAPEECQNHTCELILSYTVLKVGFKKQKQDMK